MDFKVLAVGDVVGNPGMDRICRSLRYWKRKTGADFVIVNGEHQTWIDCDKLFEKVGEIAKKHGVEVE